MVADGVDGIAARAWGSTGLGNALDSINDALTFSVAPAVFLIETYETVDGPTFRLALSIVAVVFVIAGMLRLARHQEGQDASSFKGLPVPWSAATLVALLLLGVPGWAALVATVALAGLNLSSIPYPKTRGAYTTPTLVIVAVSLGVIAWILVAGEAATMAFWIAGVVAVGMVVLAPLFAR